MTQQTVNDLSEMFTFHAICKNMCVPKINRYQAVSQLISWHNQGIRDGLKVEVENYDTTQIPNKSVWVEDTLWKEQFNRRIVKESKESKKSTTKQSKAVTLDSAVRDLKKVLATYSASVTVRAELLSTMETQLLETLNVVRSNLKLIAEHKAESK